MNTRPCQDCGHETVCFIGQYYQCPVCDIDDLPTDVDFPNDFPSEEERSLSAEELYNELVNSMPLWPPKTS